MIVPRPLRNHPWAQSTHWVIRRLLCCKLILSESHFFGVCVVYNLNIKILIHPCKLHIWNILSWLNCLLFVLLWVLCLLSPWRLKILSGVFLILLYRHYLTKSDIFLVFNVFLILRTSRESWSCGIDHKLLVNIIDLCFSLAWDPDLLIVVEKIGHLLSILQVLIELFSWLLLVFHTQPISPRHQVH